MSGRICLRARLYPLFFLGVLFLSDPSAAGERVWGTYPLDFKTLTGGGYQVSPHSKCAIWLRQMLPYLPPEMLSLAAGLPAYYLSRGIVEKGIAEISSRWPAPVRQWESGLPPRARAWIFSPPINSLSSPAHIHAEFPELRLVLPEKRDTVLLAVHIRQSIQSCLEQKGTRPFLGVKYLAFRVQEQAILVRLSNSQLHEYVAREILRLNPAASLIGGGNLNYLVRLDPHTLKLEAIVIPSFTNDMAIHDLSVDGIFDYDEIAYWMDADIRGVLDAGSDVAVSVADGN